MADVHVVPNGDHWEVEHGGATVDTFDTQQEAINTGRSVAQDEQCELVIHGTDGAIRAKDSEGNDPPSIPG